MASGQAKPLWKWLGAGAAVAVAGAAAWYVRERRNERPRYRLVEEDRDIEIREYPALIAVETIRSGDRAAALETGHELLAAYLPGRAMGAMFADITATGWRIRVLLPARIVRAELPEPPAGIRLAEIAERRVAAIRFAGRADDRQLDHKEEVLRRWLDKRGVAPTGGVEHGFYGSSHIPLPLRHNEVLIPIG